MIRAQIDDYTTKYFTLTCSLTQPEMQIGRPSDKTLHFEGRNVIYIGPDTYTRQQ